jgi:Zn-dependent protease
MILSEPGRTPYDLNFSLLGIPVRVHPMFWLVGVLLGANGSPKPQQLILWVVTVFVSILVHEMGHALAARAYGWEPWITLHSFGGLASYRPTYHDSRSRILISLAGPVAGFLLAGLVLVLIAASGHRMELAWPGALLPVRFEFYQNDAVNWLIIDMLYVNVFWGLANLLPIYPLDGGQIAQELFQLANPRDGVRQSLWLSVFVAAGLAIVVAVRWHDTFLAIFFGYLAYSSYMTITAYFGGGFGGGFGGYR